MENVVEERVLLDFLKLCAYYKLDELYIIEKGVQ